MWRGVSFRTLLLLLCGPLILDLLGASFLFWMNLGAVRMGILPHTQMAIGAMFALGYSIGAHLSGKWVTPARAPRLVLLAAILLTIEGTIVLLNPSFALYLSVAWLMGMTMAHYFMPFQVMMGDVSPFRTLAWTVAFYTISWSTGWASGPLVSGFLGQVSPTHVVAVAWVLVCLHSAIAIAARGAPRRPADEVHPHAAFTSTPTMRLMGSTGVCAVTLVTSGLGATLWLGLGAARSLSDAQIGAGAAALALPVPILALLWARCRHLMRGPWLMIAALLLGAGGVATLPLTETYLHAMICLSCLGVTASVLFFQGVYYANADPVSRPRNVSRYESIVGVGQLLGPTSLGLIAWTDATAWRAYGFAAAVLIVAACVILALSKRRDS